MSNTLTAQQIYELFHTGPGTAMWQAAQDASNQLAQDMPKLAADIARLQDAMRSAWQGEAADVAAEGAEPLALEYMQTADLLQTGQDLVGRQTGSFHTAKNSVQVVPSQPAAVDAVGAILGSPTMQQQLEQHIAAAQNNVDVYTEYHGASTYNTARLPTSFAHLRADGSTIMLTPAPPTVPATQHSGVPTPSQSHPRGAATSAPQWTTRPAQADSSDSSRLTHTDAPLPAHQPARTTSTVPASTPPFRTGPGSKPSSSGAQTSNTSPTGSPPGSGATDTSMTRDPRPTVDAGLTGFIGPSADALPAEFDQGGNGQLASTRRANRSASATGTDEPLKRSVQRLARTVEPIRRTSGGGVRSGPHNPDPAAKAAPVDGEVRRSAMSTAGEIDEEPPLMPMATGRHTPEDDEEYPVASYLQPSDPNDLFGPGEHAVRPVIGE